MTQFFRSSTARAISVLLGLQIVAFYAYPKAESVPLGRPLKDVPQVINGWKMVQESELETEVLDLLKADDTLNRIYASPQNQPASLYVAFFKSQRGGVAPHSPKVCLPGSGWVPTTSATVSVPLPASGSGQAIEVNRYLVAKGEAKSVVLYWYQTPHRVVANEYAAKVYTAFDAFRYHRTDTSLVRIVVPVTTTLKAADELAVGFVQAIFDPLKEYLPR